MQSALGRVTFRCVIGLNLWVSLGRRSLNRNMLLTNKANENRRHIYKRNRLGGIAVGLQPHPDYMEDV